MGVPLFSLRSDRLAAPSASLTRKLAQPRMEPRAVNRHGFGGTRRVCRGQVRLNSLSPQTFPLRSQYPASAAFWAPQWLGPLRLSSPSPLCAFAVKFPFSSEAA